MLIDSVEQEGKERLLKAAAYATRAGVAYVTPSRGGIFPPPFCRPPMRKPVI